MSEVVKSPLVHLPPPEITKYAWESQAILDPRQTSTSMWDPYIELNSTNGAAQQIGSGVLCGCGNQHYFPTAGVSTTPAASVKSFCDS